jgi:AbiV
MKKINIGPTKASEYFGLHVVPANTRFLNIPNHENAISLAKALWDTAGWLWSHPAMVRVMEALGRRRMSVTADFLLKGYALALEQCGLLLRDAVLLYKNRSYANAVVLAAFAREELGRSQIRLCVIHLNSSKDHPPS